MPALAVIATSGGVAEAIVRACRTTTPEISCEAWPADRLFTQADTDWLRPFDSVVYVPPLSPAGGMTPDLAASTECFAALRRARPAHAVVVSSAAIYGANHSNTGLLNESAFIADRGRDVIRRWIAFEHDAAGVATPETGLTILRPAPVLDGASYFSRLLDGKVAITYPGHDPTLQLLSPDDLAAAIRAVVARRAVGVFNVAPANAIPLKHALRLARTRRVPIPRTVQRAMRAVLAPFGFARTSEDLQHAQYSWTVSGEKLRKAIGFVPSRTSAQAILQARRRPADDPPRFDEHGMDAEYIQRYCRHLFHFLHQYYWRIEVAGLDHIPRRGRGVLVGMHRGFMPFDGVMALYALVQRVGRIPRFLIHPSLTKFPFLCDFITKLGGIMACQENGDYVLERDELLGVFPEGIRGAFTMYKRAYVLGNFGRDEYVRMALRHRAPILPFVTVGSAEIYPILGRIDWGWFKRYTEWPFLPVTNPFPLPSKWHTRFLPAMHVELSYPPEAAEDPAVVRTISLEVRQRMQAAVDEMLLQRRSIFAGTIFDKPAPL